MHIDEEREFRQAAIAWLDASAKSGQHRLTYAELAAYSHGETRIPLIDRQRGIRKPTGFSAALSIRTAYRPSGQPRPYDDREFADGTLIYKYRGDDPKHHENEAIRAAYELKLPMIWFVGVSSGVYEARFPVRVIDDRPDNLEFVFQLPPRDA